MVNTKKEKFCFYKDDAAFYKNIQILNILCFSCHSKEHLISECPLLHYTPNKLYFINQYNFSENQERYKLIRKQKKFKATNNLKTVQMNMITFNRNKTLNDESKTFGESELSAENDASDSNIALENDDKPESNNEFEPLEKAEENAERDEIFEEHSVVFFFNYLIFFLNFYCFFSSNFCLVVYVPTYKIIF